ncbi:MAG: hypothetical protein HXL34_04180 [Prevotellaceae bacterium]|nr:hypothetical protein [Prevotellaceae bacterium]
MKKIIFVISILAFIITSCTTGNNVVSYTEARNYFHNKDVPIPEQLKITTEVEFNKHFSPAAFMGKGGEVTPIDFTHSYVVAKVLPVTDRETLLKPLKLTKTGNNNLELTYQVKIGKKQSYSTQPMFIVVVDKRYKNYTVKEVVR